ncbi:MAG: glycosyltransferase family 9 protein, partial [Bryobacteraceae bacterium]|nr:glycosyltransferase family 9 protein [Bryobacteraceae bacterium]
RILSPSRREVLDFRAGLTINLHGGSRSAMLTLASMARFRAGFGHFPLRWIYNISIPRAQQILGEERVVHTAEHAASAMFYLGVSRAEIPRARLFAPPSPAQTPYAVIHPFASAAGKFWPADRFAAAARAIERNRGFRPIVIGGPGDDFTAFREFQCLEGSPLGRVKSVLSGASLFLGNDSGPAHMAAAFGIPVIVLYGTSDPVIWAPWRTPNETLKPAGGLDALPVEEVLFAVERLLDRI